LIDKKTAAILTLLALATIAGIGWFRAELGPARVLPLPEGIVNRIEYFRGYEAYLDREIFFSRVVGPSMEPTFGDNDTILWVRVDPADLEVGDIVVMYFKLPWLPRPENISHRIREVKMVGGERAFLTQGDNAWKPDGWVPQDNIRGLVIGVIYSA
jgi:signal peptidase I